MDSKKKRIGLFILYFAALYCGLLFMHYATDTYGNLYSDNAKWQLAVGRYSIYFLSKIFVFLKISLIKYQQIFMLFSIGILGVAAEMMFSSFEQMVGEKNTIILYLLSCLALGNAYSTELYLFPEYTLYNSLGVFLAVLAFVLFKCMSRKKMLISCVVLIISLGFYQANIGIFIVLCMTFILLYKGEKKYFELLFEMCLCAGGASIFNIAIKKILIRMNVTEAISRDAKLTVSTVISNLKTIIAEQKNILLLGDNLLPKYSLCIILAIGLVCLIYCMKKNNKNIIYILTTLVYLGICYLSVYAPHLIAGNVWLSPRTITPVFVFITCIFICVCVYMREKRSCINKILLICVFTFCIIDFWEVQGIIQNHIATNKIDQEYAYDIYSELLRYENETGNNIKKIATVNDAVPLWKNRYVDFYSYNVNERAYINEWSDVSLIEFVSGKMFEKVEMDNDIFEQYFKGKDWDYYCPEEQLYFKDDTMYWCKY